MLYQLSYSRYVIKMERLAGIEPATLGTQILEGNDFYALSLFVYKRKSKPLYGALSSWATVAG